MKQNSLKASSFIPIIPASQLELASLRPQVLKFLENGAPGLLLELCPKNAAELSVEQVSQTSQQLADSLGELLVQNEAGDRVVQVYDRDRSGSMHKGARYHQTREGGSIHTDNVNIPEVWDYLFLTCLSPGLVGGESILVSAEAVHAKLEESYPDVLETLKQNFYWEMRGVSDALYQAPILDYDQQNRPRFRHLRPYMESAHRKAGVDLTDEQLFALDVLDALTNSSEFQQRLKLKKGDILITQDARVLHGRTCFSDPLNAISYPQQLEGAKGPLKRTMERVWIKTK